MEFLAFLLCAYGICFGFMNKVPWLYDKKEYLDSLLTCSYCTGFWSGIFAWILMNLKHDVTWEILPLMVVHGFIGSIFCYIVDTLLQTLEKIGNTGE